MDRFEQCCLITNPSSGSNRDAAVVAVREALEENGIAIARHCEFPDDDLPSQDELRSGGIELVVIYTGDGSANAAISSLEGWGGAVLFLPGGTKNLLSKRLHGEFDAETIIKLVAAGSARRMRPNVCRCDHGWALAGLLVGPGTCWSNVREATRDVDIPAIAGGTIDAIGQTADGPPVHAQLPQIGRDQGYQLIEITPGEFGLQLDGFYADTVGDFARQGWAVLRRRFREGPHDRVGIVEEVTLASDDGSKLDLLLDGEPVAGKPTEVVSTVPCPVDMLVTGHAD